MECSKTKPCFAYCAFLLPTVRAVATVSGCGWQYVVRSAADVRMLQFVKLFTLLKVVWYFQFFQLYKYVYYKSVYRVLCYLFTSISIPTVWCSELSSRLYCRVKCRPTFKRCVLPHSSLMMEAVHTSETSADNHFTRQYNPEDNSEHHTRRRENLKSHIPTVYAFILQATVSYKNTFIHSADFLKCFMLQSVYGNMITVTGVL
jgi:hypothetical protein